MLLYPSVDALNDEVPNRYLLVNVVARKAREMADEAEGIDEKLTEKPVTLAINEVAAGKITVDPEDLYNALNAEERAEEEAEAEAETVEVEEEAQEEEI